METNCPIIYGIQKLKSQDIRIHCNTEKEKTQLSELKWDKLYKELKIRRSQFGIMLNDIHTASINPNELQSSDLMKEAQNCKIREVKTPNSQDENTTTKTQRECQTLFAHSVRCQQRYGRQLHQTWILHSSTMIPSGEV